MKIREYINGVYHFVKTGTLVKKVTAEITVLGFNELLRDRHALITGGSNGIGKAVARAFLQSGAYVTITGRNELRLNNCCEELHTEIPSARSRLSYLLMDNRDISSFKTIFSDNDWLGHIDILVNNAGVIGHDDTLNDFDNVMNTNLRSVYFLSKMVAKNMRANQIKGNILHISSSSALRPATNAYALSKWGIRGLTIGMSKVLAPYGIIVNALAPGPTATSMLKKSDTNDIALEQLPVGRYILPEEVANMAVILVSDCGRMIVGDTIYMTGGAGITTNDDILYNF